MNQNETPKKIAIALEHIKLDYGGKPLGELLSRALDILKRPAAHSEVWLSRWAIRAVCEAIIADGEAAFPLEVDLRKPQTGFWNQPITAPDSKASPVETERIEIEVPKVFLRLCEEYYKIDATRVAAALVYTFTQHPPSNLTLVKRTAETASDDDNEGEEWKVGPRGAN